MKKLSRKGNNLLIILTAFLISTLICFGMCACGDSGNTEETVEITTPSEEATSTVDNGIKIGKAAQNEDDSNNADSEDSEDKPDKSTSQYAKIYRDCDAAMKEAKDKYIEELKGESSSLSKSKLYDETQAKMEDLKKIYDENKDMMVDAMLASTEDDAKDYKKYFKKMTEAYTEYSREITSVYTDAF